MKTFLGLDIGACSTKAVTLFASGNYTELVSADVLETAEEGILNASEQYASVAGWLKEKGVDRARICTAMPHYLCTTALRDFPPNVSAWNMERMVNGEVSQIAGLSDQSFIHGFANFPPFDEFKNPALLGLCLSDAVQEKLQSFGNAGIPVRGLTIGSIAVVNAFLNLHPETRVEKAPILLLDIGHENTTAIIMSSGVPLFFSTLMFGGEKFRQVSRQLKNSTPEGKISLNDDSQSINLMNETGKSPYVLAANLLEREIQNAVEAWRSQESDTRANTPVGKVFICGGCCKFGGLKDWLQANLETPVEIFGPKIATEIHPEYALAYGLALQAAGRAPIMLSILPRELETSNLRESNFKYLAIALALLVLFTVAAEFRWYLSVSAKIRTSRAELENLENCGDLVSSITAAESKLYDAEIRAMPLVEAGNQANHLRRAMKVLKDSCGPSDWFVYLADEKTYEAARDKIWKKEDRAKRQAPPRDLFAASSVFGDTVGQEEFAQRILARNLEPTRIYVAACYTAHNPAAPFERAVQMVEALEKDPMFVGVDKLAEDRRAGREDIFKSWLAWFKNVRGQYRAFAFVLPFEECDIRKEFMPPPPKTKGKGKSKK